MPIQRKGQFLETEDLGVTHSLGIESSQLDDCIEEINRRQIDGIFGCPVFGFHEIDLNFMRDLDPIRQVWFWEIALKDIDGLYSHPNLEYFGISPKRPPIDFSKFPNLHRAVWHPYKRDRGFPELTELWSLDVWRYKPQTKSLSELELPTSLQQLEFNWCNLERLDELCILPNLEELQLHYCRNLGSLKGIQDVAPKLQKLVVTRCANLSDIDEAKDLELRHVYINVPGKEVLNRTIRYDA